VMSIGSPGTGTFQLLEGARSVSERLGMRSPSARG